MLRISVLRIGGRVRCAARILALAGMLGAALGSAQPPPSQTSEYSVKAAYLLNFGRFVTWPGASAARPALRICVLGQDPFGPLLEATVGGGKVRGRPVLTARVSQPEQTLQCDILFVSSSEAERWSLIREIVQRSPVLTVSDMPNFARQGGMIQFTLEHNRVRFEVNLEAANLAGLALSSDLLKLAVRITPAQPRG